jgi:predicted aspartyl protease
MGYVRVNVIIGDAGKRKVEEALFLVDTEVFYPVIPLNLTKDLGIEPLARTEIVLADSKKISVDVSLAYFRVLDREGISPVILMNSRNFYSE